MSQRIERVLIYRLGSLGDTVASLPCLHLVERAFPGAERRMLTNFPINSKAAAAAAILGGSGLVDGYFEYPVGSRKLSVLLKLWWRLFRWRPQVVVYLAAARGVEAAKRDQRFFRLLGGARLVGFPLSEETQRNLVMGDAIEPECERLARNLGELGDGRMDERKSWDLRLTAAEHAKAEEVLRPVGSRPLLMFSIGTKLQANDWGRERWRALMAELGREYAGYALAYTGVPAESEASAFVAEGWREGAGGDAVIVNLCGELTPRESAACFARARIFLGHDSGPMHLAASVGTPVVAVFSARNLPRMWFPYGGQHQVIYHEVDCMGCGLQECFAEHKRCIYSIAITEVLEAVGRVFAAGAPVAAGVASRAE